MISVNVAVIFAGGVGTRMNTKDMPKQFLTIFGRPIIIHTLEHFQNNKEIDAIVISCVPDWIDYLAGLTSDYHITKVKKIVEGGKTGQLSIYNGLLGVKDIANGEECIVLIHDGVRPLINSELISENIRCVKEKGNCITSGVVKETIVEINDEHQILHVPSRIHSRVAKAPQSFWLDEILAAHEKALGEGEINMIDSCTMMKHFGYQLYMIDGPYENIKITTPDDFFTMRSILEVKENRQIYLPE